MVILILFKKSKKLNELNKKLLKMNIFFEKEYNDRFINYRFNDKDIYKIMYYILYYQLKIENEEFFIKVYYKQNKLLTEKEKIDWRIQEFTRFGK